MKRFFKRLGKLIAEILMALVVGLILLAIIKYKVSKFLFFLNL